MKTVEVQLHALITYMVVSSFMPQTLYSSGKKPWYNLCRLNGMYRACRGCSGEEKIFSF
jgi:hypothetical protein